jgi:hypothetical protein
VHNPKDNERMSIKSSNAKQKTTRRRHTHRSINESLCEGGAHINEPCEGSTSIQNKGIDKRSKAGKESTRRWKTQICVTKTSKSKTKHKHTREGAQHSANETRIKTITAQTQNIKHFSCLHIQRDQRGPPPERDGT